MKKLRCFPAKLILFILSVITLILFVGSAVGTVFFFELGFYSNTKTECFAEFVFNDASRDMYNAYSAYEENGSFDAFSPDKSNLIFVMRNYKNEMIRANTTDEEYLSAQEPMFKILYVERDEGILDRFILDSFYDITEIDDFSEEELMSVVQISAWIDFSFPAEDSYYFKYIPFSWCYDIRYAIYAIVAVSAILFALSFCFLMDVTARKNGSEELHFGVLYKVPLDLLLAVTIAGFTFLNIILLKIYNSAINSAILIAAFGVLILAEVNALIGLCVTVCARIKGRTLLKNTLIYIVLRYILKFIKTIFRNLPFIWKGALITIVVIAVNYFILITARYEYPYAGSPVIAYWFIEMLPVLAAVLYCLICMSRLKKCGEEIANGNISYKTDTRIMLGAFRKHGENLNSIADVTSKAVEERLKSERMKTQLITNVSHDIKTPLTSIINYSELIGAQECSCEKHSEYAEVLKRKSESLKRLLSDLVEVSKASSGALEISLEPCDAGVLIDQLYGEYEQRCREAGLELVVKPPDGQITVLTDNRKIWRVFENLMNNACKYSLKGSRVYVGVRQNGDNAVFSVWSTSAKPLDMTPAELMERFVRGDASRSTEGSGLGLSIAESLTAAQGGKMDLAIDGDLFKVTLAFKITNRVQPQGG